MLSIAGTLAPPGLGTGTIGLLVDDRGAPTAFYWRGGVSPQAKPTRIALGRPQ